MEKLIIHEDRCKNCLYCVVNCPKKALSVNKDKINAKGYPPVQVDRGLCVTCGICFTVCPDYVYEIREVD